MVVAVIPARYASTRLPGKPLIDLNGQTMLERVWRAASSATLVDRVLIATDDERIMEAAGGFGASAVMTSPDLPSGTDRCYAAITQSGQQADIVINVQGDEPLLPSDLLDDLVRAVRLGDADVATPIARITDTADLLNENVVKVVVASSGLATYFSRAAVPHARGRGVDSWLEHHRYWKHVGLYAYTMDALEQHVALPVSDLELTEALEQLRLLERGLRYRCVVTEANLHGVDTQDDVERVRTMLRL